MKEEIIGGLKLIIMIPLVLASMGIEVIILLIMSLVTTNLMKWQLGMLGIEIGDKLTILVFVCILVLWILILPKIHALRNSETSLYR